MSREEGSDHELDAAFGQAADALKRWLARSPDARAIARAIARWLTEASRESDEQAAATAVPATRMEPAGIQGGSVVEPAGQASSPPVLFGPKRITGPRVVTPAEPVLEAGEAARALTAGLGGGGTSPRVSGVQAGPPPPSGTAIGISMEMIGRRARLQSEACAFAVDRNRLGFDAVKARYDKLRADAEPIQPCYLWAIHRTTEFLDDALLETAGGCYTNFASAAELVHGSPDEMVGLELLAEAQAALFQLLFEVEQAGGGDRDQRTAWAWLRARVERGEIGSRVLEAARSVDPTAWRGLEARLSAARERIDATRRGERARRQALNTIQYHAGRIGEAHEVIEGEPAAEVSHDWHKVQAAASAFLSAGGQASDTALVEALVPVAEQVPESMLEAEPFALIMPFLDERLSADEEGEAEPAGPARRVTDELLKAREMLRGKTVVLLGGKCRHKSKRLIERELELKELRWLSSDPHVSIAPFEAEIARPEVGAVLMMIRWSSHSFEGVKEFCQKHDKPYVRVPAGYNPSQLAHQIILQHGGRV